MLQGFVWKNFLASEEVFNMNLLFLLFIDMTKNGPSVHLLNDIIGVAKKRGHSVTVVNKGYECRNNIVDVTDEKETRITVASKLPAKSNYIERYVSEIEYIFGYKRELKGKKFDAVFLQSNTNAGFHSFWIKHCIKSPFLFNVQDIFPLGAYYEGIISNSGVAYKVLNAIQKYAYKSASAIITISEDMKKTLQQLGVPENKISVVYNWAYVSRFDTIDDECVRQLIFNNGKFNVVYAGNIGMAQNVLFIVKAAKILKNCEDIQFIIIGNGAKKDLCQKLASKENLNNIKFYDMLPQKYSQYIYKNSDINLVTLQKGIYETSLPSKTAVCYSCGKPVIFCIENESSSVDVMLKNNNLVYQTDPEDETSLANLIAKIRKNMYSLDDIKIKPYKEILTPQTPEFYVDELEKITRR